jgi:hypothetical protein
MIYELLAGTRPFVASGQINWAQRHLYDRPYLLSSAVPFPPAFLPVVEKCLEKHKEDRYRSVSELRADVLEAGRASAAAQPWLERPGVPRPPISLLSQLTRGATAMFLAFAMFVLTIGMVVVNEVTADEKEFRMSPAAVQVDSEPRGAVIIIDGEPTGLTTPALIEALVKDRDVVITLEKNGRTAQQVVRLQSGKRENVMIQVLSE